MSDCVVGGGLNETIEGDFSAGNVEGQLTILCLFGSLEVSVVVEIQVSASNLIVYGAIFGSFFITGTSLSALSGDRDEVGIRFGN